jgi:hypothetical protein
VRRDQILLSLAGLIAAAAVWFVLAGMLAADPTASLPQRLAAALAALLPVDAVFGAMILTQILARAASGAIDPTAGRDNRFLQVNQRALTNSVEQLLIFIPALLALAAGVAPFAMPKVIALALTFALARLVFWLGYLIAPLLRAPGMAATGAVNLCTLAAACWVWVS